MPPEETKDPEQTKLLTVTLKAPVAPPPAAPQPTAASAASLAAGSVPPKPAGAPVTAPAAGNIPPKPATPPPPGQPAKPSFASPVAAPLNPAEVLFGTEEEREKVKKKRIMLGVLGGSFLLGAGILLSSAKGGAPAAPVKGGGFDHMGEPDNSSHHAATNAATTPAATPATEPAKTVLSTDHPVYDKPTDNLTLEEAREEAREAVGANGFFMYNGEIHANLTEAEFNEMSPDEQSHYLSGINIQDDQPAYLNIAGDDQTYDLVMKFFADPEQGSIVKDDSDNFFYVSADGEKAYLPDFHEDSSGALMSYDESGAEVHVNPTLVYAELADGNINVQAFPDDPSDINNLPEPIDQLQIISQWIDTDGDGKPDTQIMGWDTNGDGTVDLIDNGDGKFDVTTDTQTPAEYIAELHWNDDVTPNTTDDTPATTPEATGPKQPESRADELIDKAHQLAQDNGIDHISKEKITGHDDGSYDIKIKGEDGEKFKMHLSQEDLDHSAHHQTDAPAEPAEHQTEAPADQPADTGPQTEATPAEQDGSTPAPDHFSFPDYNTESFPANSDDVV